MRRHLTGMGGAVVLAVFAVVSVRAHEETFRGAVIALNKEKLEVMVINEKTKKDAPMVFEITAKTRVFRGDKEVKIADAHITKDERIAVTINHDTPGQKATIVRLAAH